MKKSLFVLAAVILSSQLHAQHDTASMDEVILTANKFEQKQSQTGKVVTVISRDQLEKSNGKSLGQLLTEQAGLTISAAYNATGSVQTVFMRGASSGRTLILVDGIPVSDPSMINNEFDLNLLSIHDIERIEISRGAQSTLYGSDAIAGAINIITTKKDIAKPFNVKATSVFGNKNTARNSVQFFGNIGNKLTYSARYAKLVTDGFSSANDKNQTGTFDKDGYTGNLGSATIQYQVIPSLLLRTFIQYSKYKADVDAGLFSDDRDYTINNDGLASGAGLNFKKGKVNIVGNYQYGKLNRRYLNDSLYFVNGGTKYEQNNYGAKTQYAELYSSITATDWLTILAGFDYRKGSMNQQYESVHTIFGGYESEFENKSLDQSSLYGSLLFNAFDKKLNIEVGGRYNDHSRYGNNSTYTFNPSYIFNNHLRIFGSIASGFKAPSIFQVYDVFSGNEELKPEKSTNYEIGLQQTHPLISSRAVYFHRDIKDGIDYDYVNYKYFNFVKQTVDGLELEVTAKPAKAIILTANYTLVTGEEQTQSRKTFNDTTYDQLLRRPKHSFNFTAGYQFCPDFFASVSGRAVSERYDVGGFMSDDVSLDGYFLLSAYAEYKYGKHVRIFADIQNLTDKKFFDIRGYNAMPFMISGGITFNW
jgi:vitamin B12 transporter